MALYRALEGKRKKICQDYGQILIEPCKIEAVSFEKTDANFRIRGFLQNDKKSNYSLNNISIWLHSRTGGDIIQKYWQMLELVKHS